VRDKTRPVKVYKFVTDYVLEHNRIPTTAEIAESIRIADETARCHVFSLEAAGMLKRRFGQSEVRE